ncbi:hypothetical protein LCGC14_2785770, partial [marine sediment metagenome]
MTALWPLHRLNPVKRITAATYQSVSGTGKLAVEELNLLDADAFARAERDFAQIAEPQQRLLALLTDTAQRMPGDVPALYNWMLDRAEKLFGAAWARSFVNLIGVSRAGWRESDFRVLMPRISGQTWDELQFAALRRIFRAHVVQRGSLGQWDFFHTQMRLSVRARMREQDVDPRSVHVAVAEYLLEDLPREDPLHETETMVHLIGADDRPGAAACYGAELTDGEQRGATQPLADFILGALPAWTVPPSADAPAWVAALPAETGLTAHARGRLCERLVWPLDDLLKPRAPLPSRLLYLERA